MSALNGYKNYLTTTLPSVKDSLKGIEKGQAPETLFITCSDSRIMPNQMTDTKHGELFVIRNAGNSLPSATVGLATKDADAATLEYAVKALGVKEIIICGHSHCGAMGAVCSGVDHSQLPFVGGYLDRFSELKQIQEKENWSSERLINENIKYQVDNLKSYDFVKEKVEAGELKLTGWLYHLESGEIEEIC